MTMTRAILAVILPLLLSSCFKSVGIPPDAVCRTDADCAPGLGCTPGGACQCFERTCGGCCSADGSECRVGVDDNACGFDGEICEDCTARDKVCAAGTCIYPECENECDEDGEKTCLDEWSYLVCDDHDDDGCLEWGEAVPCPEGEFCVGDGCGPSCVDQCSYDDEFQCLTSGFWQICGINEYGCLVWVHNGSCDTGMVCDVSVRGCVSTCTNECHSADFFECVEPNSWRVCGFRDDSCLDWIDEGDCGDGEICDDVSRTCIPNTCPDDCLEETPTGCSVDARATRECRYDPGTSCLSWVEDECTTSTPFCEGGRCSCLVSYIAASRRYEITCDGAYRCAFYSTGENEVTDVTLGDIDDDGMLEIVAVYDGIRSGGVGHSAIATIEDDCEEYGLIMTGVEEHIYSLLLVDLDASGVVDIVYGAGGLSGGSYIRAYRWDGERVSSLWSAEAGGHGISSLELLPGDIIRGTTSDGDTSLCVQLDGVVVPCS